MDLQNSIPLSEAVVQFEQNAAPSDHNKFCLNCGTTLSGPYCFSCGQKDIPPRQTLGELCVNFISSFWSYESKFFQTGQYLLFKPGKLAIEYSSGKRERYFHPARMYVFISFVFFLLLATLPDGDEEENSNFNFNLVAPGEKKPAQTKEFKKGLEVDEAAISDLTKGYSHYDSVQRALAPDKRDGAIKSWIKRRALRIEERYHGRGNDLKEALMAGFQENVPKVFFFLLPFFALLLKALYARRDYFYSEHLVFSIYYYNFIFLAGSLYLIVDLIPFISGFSFLIILWIVTYLLLAMKRMYKQSWGKTILKFCTFCFIFSFFVGAGLLLNLAFTLASL